MRERIDEDVAFGKARQRALDQPPAPEDLFSEDELATTCPDCGAELKCASGGGVVCSKNCGWWFCY